VRVLPTPLLAALALAACSDDTGPPPVDRSSPLTVFSASMKAVHEKDLPSLWRLLTPEARVEVEQNLKDWQRGLNDPSRWADIERRIREHYGEVPVQELERARTGGLEDVWRFFLTIDPRPRMPRLEAENLQTTEDERTVRVLYYDPRDVLREVRLQRMPTGWYVDEFQL
jgi:hypothetical protein